MSTYTGSNAQLQYDATTGTWSLANVAQNFVDTSTFSTADPKFEYATADDSDDDTTIDPCPLGYMLQDGACVIDPNYVPPSQVSSGGGGGGGGQTTPTPRQQSDYDLGREALESFSALKDKIDFESYDSKTKTVGLKEPENKNLLETVFTLFSPGTAIMNAVFDAKDKSDLGAIQFGGVKAYSENEEGEGVINLEVLHNFTQTKVLNPGVPEGNLLAGTPSYEGTDDTDGFYKTFFTSFEIPKEQRKFFGASSIEDIFAATEKARIASEGLLKKPTSGIPTLRDKATEEKEDTLSDLDNLMEQSQSKDSGVPPGTGSTGAPGRNYESSGDNISEYTQAADNNRKNRMAQNQQFTKASQTAAKARANTQKEKEKRGTMGSSGSFGGKGGGAPGY